MLRRRPFSLSAFRLVEGLQRAGLGFRTVLDVGANIGQFAAAAAGSWPEARILAFEPLPAAAEALRRRAGVEVYQIAVGDRDGSTVFYPHAYSLSSSALPVLDDLRTRAWAKETAAIEVPMCRLDTVLAGERLEGPVLLKLDVQGLEPAVLAGAPETLRRVDAMVVEVAFEPSYEDQALFADVHGALVAAGWTKVQPLDWRLEGGRIVEADFLYRRR
ncbi:MAG: FkbM family methyltransferase [Actinomycetota bacterium]|nr:FkbM family methyltransferase [Actinomycetota bacterium]